MPVADQWFVVTLQSIAKRLGRWQTERDESRARWCQAAAAAPGSRDLKPDFASG